MSYQGLALSLPPKVSKRLSNPSDTIAVQRLDYMGTDIDIVNAARVSFMKESEYEWSPELEALMLKGDDYGVLNYMMRERHGTPWEAVVLKFRVRAPIGVVWEWVRHRISSFNVASTRYVQWSRDYYVPEYQDWRTQIGKPGNYLFAQLPHDKIEPMLERYVNSMERAFDDYEWLVNEGLAKEVARNVLPMGAITEFIWTVNLRSLFNFLSLRTAPNALREIQIAANMVEGLAFEVAPNAFELFTKHGRVAP